MTVFNTSNIYHNQTFETNTTTNRSSFNGYTESNVYKIQVFVWYAAPLMAIVFNWICILVLRHGRKRRKTTPAIYFLIHVSHFDTIAMIAPFYTTYASIGLWSVTKLGCQITMYLQHISKDMAIWCMAFVCLERAINAYKGFLHHSIDLALKVQLVFWCVLFLVAGEQIFILLWMDSIQVLNNHTSCFPSTFQLQKWYVYVLCVVNGLFNHIIPLILVICTNAYTMIQVRKVQPTLQFYQIQMTISVIMVSYFGILLYIPHTVSLVLSSFPKFKVNPFVMDIWLMADIFDAVNHSCKLFLYLTYSWLFREDMWHFFSCQQYRQPNENEYLHRDNMIFTRHVTSEDVMETESVTFECETVAAGRKVKWCYNDQTLYPDQHYEMISDGHTHKLTIHNVSMSDLGYYKACIGTSQSSGHLHIREKPSPFNTLLEDRQCIEGEDVVFECVTSQAKCNMIWLKGEQEVFANERIEQVVHGHVHQLIITNTQLDDGGLYSCLVDKDYCSALLEVEEKVIRNFALHHSLLLGKAGKLVCELFRPLYSVQWYRKGQVLIDSDKYEITSEVGGMSHQLILHDITQEDGGEYTLVADYHSQSTFVTICTDIFTSKMVDQECVEGDDISLECQTIALEGQREGQWEKDGIFVNIQNSREEDKYELTSDGNVYRLGINNVQLSDAGMYSLLIDGFSCSAHLHVKECSKIFTVPLKELSCKVNSAFVTLHCKTCISVPSVEWKKDGHSLAADKNKYQVVHDNVEHKLIIYNLDIYDSGVYSASLDHRTTAAKLVVQETKQSLRNQDLIIEAIEAAYPVPLSIMDVQSCFPTLPKDVVQKLLAVLEHKKVIHEEKTGRFARIISSHLNDELPIELLYDNMTWHPDFVIIVCSFTAMAAAEAVMTEKVVYMSKNINDGCASRLAITGKIGKNNILVIKISQNGNRLMKEINCGHIISYFSGKFQSANRWILLSITHRDCVSPNDVIVSMPLQGRELKFKNYFFEMNNIEVTGDHTSQRENDFKPLPTHELKSNSMYKTIQAMFRLHSNTQLSHLNSYLQTAKGVLETELKRSISYCNSSKDSKTKSSGPTFNSTIQIDRPASRFPDIIEPVTMSHPSTRSKSFKHIQELKKATKSKRTISIDSENAASLSTDDNDLYQVITTLKANLDQSKEWIVIKGAVSNCGMGNVSVYDQKISAGLHAAVLMKSLVISMSKT